MIRKRSMKQVRRYDILKLTVLLLLLIMIFALLLRENNTTYLASAIISDDQSIAEDSYPTASDAGAESGYPQGEALEIEPGNPREAYPADEFVAATEETSDDSLHPAPPEETVQEPVRPTVSLPEDDVFAGAVKLRGTGQPGTQVQLYANGDVIGTAGVDVSGDYAITVFLNAGLYEIDVAALDVSGRLAERIPALSLPVFALHPQNIYTIVAANKELTVLTAALEATNLEQRISSNSELQTLIAPTDSAFSTIPAEIFLGWEANPEAFRNILLNLLFPGKLTQEDLLAAKSVTNGAGRAVEFSSDGALTYINSVPIHVSIHASNGMIHTIERIVMPPLSPRIQPPIVESIDSFIDDGDYLTVKGLAEPGTRILLQVNGGTFGEVAFVDDDGSWTIAGRLDGRISEEKRVVAFMIDDQGLLMAISPVTS